MAPTRSLLCDSRLLIIEDEALIAMLLEDFAVELGCRASMTAATTGQALLAIETLGPQMAPVECSLNQCSPQFVVTDTLADAMIPFIFTSRHNISVLPERHHSQNFLTKRFSVEALESTILRVRAYQPFHA